MSVKEYKDIDFTVVETEARRLRAEYIAGFFKRRNR